MNLFELDNPIWTALTTQQRSMARIHGLAARFSDDVSPLTGMQNWTREAFDDLKHLVDDGRPVVLFTNAPVEPSVGWQFVQQRWIDEMVCTTPLSANSSAEPIIQLGEADIPDMLALTAATEPGPFLPRTIDMGRYYGIRSDDGRLAAMAGQRLCIDRFREISAVCTLPEFRGRGLSRALVVLLSNEILNEGRIPFLHVMPENIAARKLYESVGFFDRQRIRLTVLKKSSNRFVRTAR